MDVTSKHCEAAIGQTLPPPYPGVDQDVKAPSSPTELQQVTSVDVVQTQRVTRVINRPDPPIETFFACSIFVMIFCCLPFGIVALVYASQQRSMESVGNFQEARRASSQAKCWSYAGFFTGLAFLVGIILWVFLSNPYY